MPRAQPHTRLIAEMGLVHDASGWLVKSAGAAGGFCGLPRHPGSPTLDLDDPEDAEWAASIRSMKTARRVRAAGIVAAIACTAVLGSLFFGDAADLEFKAALLGCVFVASMSIVAIRISRDAWRAATGRDTTPDGHALRRTTALRSAMGMTGSLLATIGFHAIFEAMAVGFEGFVVAMLAMGPLGLLLIAAAAKVRLQLEEPAGRVKARVPSELRTDPATRLLRTRRKPPSRSAGALTWPPPLWRTGCQRKS